MFCKGSSDQYAHYRDLTLKPLRLVEDMAVPSTADSSCIGFWSQVPPTPTDRPHARLLSFSVYLYGEHLLNQLGGDSKLSKTQEEPTVVFLNISCHSLPAPYMSTDTS